MAHGSAKYLFTRLGASHRSHRPVGYSTLDKRPTIRAEYYGIDDLIRMSHDPPMTCTRLGVPRSHQARPHITLPSVSLCSRVSD